MSTDPRVDAYIAKKADFAQVIMIHLRSLVHATCPEAEEAIKWSMPFFTYRGQNLCNMAGFKAHVAFGFWHDKVAGDAMEVGGEGAMGQMGRIASLTDLPPDAEIAALIRKGMALIDAGEKPRQDVKPRADQPIAPEFQAAIDANPTAAAVWASFTPGKIRDYVEWINDAKRAETRDKRIAQAVAWIAEGKDRNWKYKNC